MSKALFIGAALFVLAACTGFPNPFDNIEYDHLIRLNVLAEKADCSVSNRVRMLEESRFLVKFSGGRLNENVNSIYVGISDLTQELHDRQDPSSSYCSIKNEQIESLTQEAIDVFGQRR